MPRRPSPGRATPSCTSSVVRETGSSGDTSYRFESWQETSAPFALRWLRTGPGGQRLETLNVDGSAQLYDASTNTIYTNAAGVRKPAAGVQGPSTNKPSSSKPAARSAKGSEPPLGGPSAGSDFYRDKILSILRSGAVSVEGHAAVAGRDTLRLVSGDGSVTIDVDPQSYRPVQWHTVSPEGSETTTFDTYEELPRGPANDALLSLTAQHPSARVDSSAADYQAALERLFGKR